MRPGWLFACLAAVAICSLTRLHPPAVHAQQAYLAGADQIFQARCSTCHAEHAGEGSEVGASLNVPDLRSQSVQQLNDDQLRRIIQEGKGDMPRFQAGLHRGRDRPAHQTGPQLRPPKSLPRTMKFQIPPLIQITIVLPPIARLPISIGE